MIIKDTIKTIFKAAGLKVSRYSEEVNREFDLLRRYRINKILDVGANTGDYALSRRRIGYDNEIISFEPVSIPFNTLKKNAQNDPKWKIEQIALGNYDGVAEINVAGNSYSSSLLEMLPQHLNSAPESAYISKEEIVIKKLDSIFDKYCNKQDKILLKIDTQGFERQVLEGSSNSLQDITGIQMEMSLIPLYKNEMLYREAIDYLGNLGFKLCLIENGFSDPKTFQLLQIDGIFYR